MRNHTNILFYDILDKILFSSKPLCIRFDKVDGFIRVYDGMRYLVLFTPKKHDVIYKRIWCLLLLAKEVTVHMFFSHNSAKIKFDSSDSLPLEKTLTFRNVIILIKSVLNKDTNTAIAMYF